MSGDMGSKTKTTESRYIKTGLFTVGMLVGGLYQNSYPRRKGFCHSFFWGGAGVASTKGAGTEKAKHDSQSSSEDLFLHHFDSNVATY